MAPIIVILLPLSFGKSYVIGIRECLGYHIFPLISQRWVDVSSMYIISFFYYVYFANYEMKANRFFVNSYSFYALWNA